MGALLPPASSCGSSLTIGSCSRAYVELVNAREHEPIVSDEPQLLAGGDGGANPVGSARRSAAATRLQALHEHVVRTSPVGNTIERPIEFDARLIRS